MYNAKSGLALACPIMNQAKGYPFEVAVPAGCGATGVILADHVKSIDWKARRKNRALHNRSVRRGAGQAGAAARVLKPKVDHWAGRLSQLGKAKRGLFGRLDICVLSPDHGDRFLCGL
jgi:ribosomal protein S27AE